MTMSEKETPRDRAWLAVIDLLEGAQDIQVDQIAQGGNVSTDTARAVLRVAEHYDVLERETEQGHTYHPNIGALAHVDNPEYRRMIATLIGEANQEN
jgi:hypothetical protein